MANTTNRTTRIKHVFGNVLKLAIPLTLRTVTLEGGIVEVTDTDYTPSNHYPVVVQFVNGPLKYELNATIRDNYIAVVEDKGTIPVGNYAIVVLCKDDNGDPRRFKQRCVLEVVDVTADAGIEVGIEFEVQEWLLDGAIFLAIKGEDGIDGVGIESITTDETSVSGEYNQVTFHLTNGSSYTLNVRNGESTEQTLPANVVVDENYVHTDNNYTDTDKQKIESVDKLFGDAEYDRISRRLNFFKHGDTMHTNPLKSIDITDFIRDSRVSSFRIVDGNLTIRLNSDGNNEEFKVPITSINANYYTKSQVDSLYSSLSSRVTPVEVIFTESNDSITSNRTVNGIYTDYTNKKTIIGRYGNSVGTLLYISSQEAAFIFGDRYDKPFILRNSGSTHWGKEDLVDFSSFIDYEPTPESENAVSSGGVWDYLAQRIQSVTINGTTKTPDENGDVSFTVQGGGGYEPPAGGIPKSDLAQSVQDTLDDVGNKVDKETGKGLSTNDYTTAEKTKLASLENYDDSALQTAIDGKVDKESGKSLMTDAEHTKLAGIDPSTYATKTEVNAKQDTINDLDAIRSGAALGATALQSFTETDPTVPSWAKAESKPTYTAQEVGALPASTTIPTKVSDLTNDSGFTSNAGTITGITMNGASKGTSGVVDLGTVITAHQDISGKANASDVYTKTQTDTLLSGKQDTLTFDTTPTANSTKPVTSGGIKTYVDGKATITGITTSQDGTFTIALSDGNSYTVNLNHVHSQYVESSDLADVATSGSYNDLTNKPTIPTVDTTITQNSTNAAQSGAVYTALAGKQNTLTFDNAPTSGSNNPVKSGGVYTALAGKADTSTTYTKSEIDTKIGNIETILASI